MKALGIAAKWIFILCLPILLMSASIGVAVNSLGLYKYGFEKYNISQTTGLAEAELERAAASLISYFNSGEEHISVYVTKDGRQFKLFNQREVIHLKDVKELIWLDYRLLVGTLLYVLIYAGVELLWRKDWHRLASGIFGGSGLTLALMLALGMGALISFDRLFLQFHLISFSNEFWSAEGYMLLLFPQGFWYDASLFCALATVGLAVIFGGASGGYLMFTRRRAVSL